MLLKRFLKYISFILICLSILILVLLKVNHKFDKEKHLNLINKSINVKTNYTNVPYIEIPSVDITRVIKEDNNQKVLDDGYVIIFNENKDLYSINNLILAGHNTVNIFKNLKNIKLNDYIYIRYKNTKFTYKVNSKKIIDVKEISYLDETQYKNISLITCTNDDQKRLLVLGSLYKKEIL